MTDSKYFTTTKKGEIFELKSELNNEKKEKKKEAVKKVMMIYLYSSLNSQVFRHNYNFSFISNPIYYKKSAFLCSICAG